MTLGTQNNNQNIICIQNLDLMDKNGKLGSKKGVWGLNPFTLRDILADKLERWELERLFRSYDIIGDIAIIRVPQPLRKRKELIAKAILQTHKRVKTVLQQTTPVSDEFRLRGLEWIAGEKKTETLYKEYSCVFKVDLEKCYFSPRLSYERMRIAKEVQPGEVVVNMFAGVGCYSILIAKHAKARKVYSIDLNPDAVRYMHENILLNKVQNQVVAIQGDAKTLIQQTLKNKAERVLMPLPERAYEYLDYALFALKPVGGWIHYYDFEHAKKPENPIETVKAKVTEKLKRFAVDFEIPFQRIVRDVGPNWFQVVLDIKVKRFL